MLTKHMAITNSGRASFVLVVNLQEHPPNYGHVDLDAITDVPRGKQQAKENSGY